MKGRVETQLDGLGGRVQTQRNTHCLHFPVLDEDRILAIQHAADTAHSLRHASKGQLTKTAACATVQKDQLAKAISSQRSVRSLRHDPTRRTQKTATG